MMTSKVKLKLVVTFSENNYKHDILKIDIIIRERSQTRQYQSKL